MNTPRILLAVALAASAFVLVPAADASPPTCDGPWGDHALASYVMCNEVKRQLEECLRAQLEGAEGC